MSNCLSEDVFEDVGLSEDYSFREYLRVLVSSEIRCNFFLGISIWCSLYFVQKSHGSRGASSECAGLFPTVA